MVTLIFINGRGSAISSAKQGKSGSICIISCLGRANVRAFHENSNRIHIELTFINPQNTIITKCMFLSPTKVFEAPWTNTVDPAQILFLHDEIICMHCSLQMKQTYSHRLFSCPCSDTNL